MHREPTSSDQLQEAAEAVLSMVRIIRQHLPVHGDAGSKSNPNVMDAWLERAGDDYTTFERIRNADRLPWPGPRGRFFVVVPSRAASAYWQELCYAIEPVVSHYGWQGISDERTISGPYFFRAGRPAPPIDADVLERVEIAARGLLAEFTAAENAGRRIPTFRDHSNDALAVTVTTGNPAVATVAKSNGTEPDGRIEHDTYRVDSRDVPDLAPNEIKLLELVHTRPDNAPNEADILVAVWGKDGLSTRKDIDRLYPRVNAKLSRAKCKRRLRWSSKRMVLRIPKPPARSLAKKTTRTRRGKRGGKK